MMTEIKDLDGVPEKMSSLGGPTLKKDNKITSICLTCFTPSVENRHSNTLKSEG